jgi:4-amino-4-deoxy-L-arabinose transferase-like glycosyltransferase
MPVELSDPGLDVPAIGRGAPERRRRRPLSGGRWWLAGGLLLVWGLRLALLAGPQLEGYRRSALVVLLVPLLALWPAAARAVASAVGRVRRLPRRWRGWVALGLSVAAMTYLYASTVRQGLRFEPLIKDEYSYLLQARMLSTGRLWMPRHPLSDFFETTSVITDRAYASMYPPGTALLFAPGVRLGWPHWVVPMLVSGLALALLYLVTAALVDGWAGFAAVALMVGCGLFQTMWRYAMGSIPMMLLGLGVVWCFLHWKARRHSLVWAAATGALAGWGLIIRPQDAVCYVLPVAVAMLLSLHRRPKRVLASIATCVVAAAPFLALQLAVNVGVTGKWNGFPHDSYHRRDLPNLGYGFYDRGNFDDRPQSVSPQKQAEFDAEVAGIRKLQMRNRGDLWDLSNARIPTLLKATLPDPFLAVVLPVGILAAGRRWRWVLAAAVPLFVVTYIPWPFILLHYPLPIAPGVVLLVLLGMRALERHAGRFRPTLTAVFALAVLAAMIVALPEVNPVKAAPDPVVVTPRDVDRAVRRVTQGRAVVLLRYDPSNGSRMRTFNLDVAWPDDAPIVKALDLGERDGEIIRYYAKLQPDREFFLYDFADDSMTRLGNVKGLATQSSPVPPRPPVTP